MRDPATYRDRPMTHTLSMFLRVLVFTAITFDGTDWLVADTQPTAPARLNILWLIAEDMGPEALGCSGTPQAFTPNIDRLAAEGVRYTHAYLGMVCSVSRSSFMTGMYSTSISTHNHRSHREDGYRLPEGLRVLTDRLRDVGYFTANLKKLPPQCG